MIMTKDETQIRSLLDDFTRAIRNRDADGAINLLAGDAVTFDLAPPLRMGPEASHDRSKLEEWFATWKSPINSQSHDLEIAVGDGVAYAYGLQHMTGTKTDGENVDLWFRATACFRRKDGHWCITHMHNSVPFAMDGSDKALLDLKP
jgi:ketosteroid isomerase-like protein